MSFTCLGDELDRLCPFASLCNRTGGQDLHPPRIAGTVGAHLPAPPPVSSETLLLFNTMKTWPLVWFLGCWVLFFFFFPPYILSQWHFDKDKSLLVLKGICIYKSGERILTWDLGDGEWSRLSHRQAEWFLANCRTFLDCNFLTEKIMLDMVHRSNCANHCSTWRCQRKATI